MTNQLLGAGIIGVAIGIAISYFVYWITGIIDERNELRERLKKDAKHKVN